MGANIPYTDQEKKIFREMHAKGYGPHEIAKVLKTRTARGIKDYGYQLGIVWTKEPEIDMAEFKRLMGGK